MGVSVLHPHDPSHKRHPAASPTFSTLRTRKAKQRLTLPRTQWTRGLVPSTVRCPPGTPRLSTNLDTVSEFYTALNRGDLPALAQHLDPEIVRIEPAGFATEGTYRGIAAVQAHIARGRGTWAEGACEPEEFFERGDKVVAYVHVRVRLKNSAAWVEGRFADGFTFRAGKIVEFRSFAQRAEARAWTGC
jgi:ketosteroid isomerase-like protein